MSKEYPTMATNITQAFFEMMWSYNFVRPGVILEYDQATRFAKVQLLQKSTLPIRNFTAVPQAQIDHVSVWLPRTKTAYFELPIGAGCIGICLFNDRSMDALLDTDLSALEGGNPADMVDPQDTRMHSDSDAYFLPGFYAGKFALSGLDETDIGFGRDENGGVSAKIRITNDGTVEIETTKDVSVTCEGDATIEAQGDASINAQGDVSIESAQAVDVTGNSQVNVDAAAVNIGTGGEPMTKGTTLKSWLDTHVHLIPGALAGGPGITSNIPTVLSPVGMLSTKATVE